MKLKSEVISMDNYGNYAEINEMYASRWRELDLLIPGNFRMICAILNVKPERILIDFMWKLSCSAIDGATKKQRKAAQKFMLLSSFGDPFYSKNDLKKMFSELKAIRELSDTTGSMEEDNKELFWKNNHMYTEFWFKHWFEKNTRQDDLTVLGKF